MGRRAGFGAAAPRRLGAAAPRRRDVLFTQHCGAGGQGSHVPGTQLGAQVGAGGAGGAGGVQGSPPVPLRCSGASRPGFGGHKVP